MSPELIKLEATFGQSILTKIDAPLLERHNVKFWLKRDDLLHPIISGNKWRKLRYSLDEALSLGADTIISMGGTYSNHLHALAFVGKCLGLKTIGIIRGVRPVLLTPTLCDMENWGMELRFISRSDYRHYRNFKGYDGLPGIKPNQYWLPEGGGSNLALKGIAELVAEIDIPFDVLCVACGTGTTLAGLVSAVTEEQAVFGFAALKNASFLEADVRALIYKEFHNWAIVHDYHFGGFAKLTPELKLFMASFEERTAIPLEPVYTGKMLYGVYDRLAKGYFKSGQRIIALHTGGLQGNRGYK